MEIIGIILLLCILAMGCIIFYLFLQFNRISRENQDATRTIGQRLEKLSDKIDQMSKPSS